MLFTGVATCKGTAGTCGSTRADDGPVASSSAAGVSGGEGTMAPALSHWEHGQADGGVVGVFDAVDCQSDSIKER